MNRFHSAAIGAGIAMILCGVVLLFVALHVATETGGDGTPFLIAGLASIVTGASLAGYGIG